jgi:phytoene synthase
MVGHGDLVGPGEFMIADSIAADDDACAAVLRGSASSFALPIRLLPPAKRRATTALYAFCRKADDIVDDGIDRESARQTLARFQEGLDTALRGDGADDAVLRAVADAVRRFGIPPRYLHEIIEGVRMDLDQADYRSFDDLQVYCRRVASAVGLAAIHIWGFHSDDALGPADACGLAFQLTNILRDIPEDLARGRVYLPADDMAACGCSRTDLESMRIGPGFTKLASMEVARAEAFFDDASRLDRLLSADGRLVFRAMFGVYRAMLAEVRRAGHAIFTTKIRPSKTALIGSGIMAVALGARPRKERRP